MKKGPDPYTSSIEGYLSRTEQLEKLEREISVYPTEHPIYTCSQYETLFQNNVVPSSFSKCRDMILDFMQYHNETAYLYGISMGIMNLPDKENHSSQYVCQTVSKKVRKTAPFTFGKWRCRLLQTALPNCSGCGQEASN